MRDRSILTVLLLTLLCSGCSELDSFLFNTEKVESYKLPGNTIPDSLLRHVMMRSGEMDNIYGYWVASNGERPGLTILYSHGNRHNLDEYWDRVMMLHKLGGNVFIYDYRGFGMSEGVSTEKGLYEDAEVALHYVRSQGTPDDSLVLYGFSLGNVPTLHLAANKVVPRCVISEAPFASANSLTQGGTGLDLPPRWITDGTFNNVEVVKKIRSPYLLLHGEDDDFVRYRDNGRLVYQNAPDPKKLIVVPGALHTTVPQTMGEERYLEALREWIDRRE